MSSYDFAIYLTVGLVLAGLVGAVIGLCFLGWRVWRHRGGWWRWPTLVLIAVCLLGGAVSLGQMAGELYGA